MRRLGGWCSGRVVGAVLAGVGAATVAMAAAPVAGPGGDFSRHVPPGWRLLSSVTGDLDGDGREDAALVLEKTDAARRQSNPGLGAPELNLNPRRLLVLMQVGPGERVLLRRDGLLPSENDAESPCLADPLDGGGVTMPPGRLVLELQHWTSCGSYGAGQEQFIFRLEGARLRLIGHERSEFSRASGEQTEVSTNLLTGQRKTVEGLNVFERSSTARTRWQRLGTLAPVFLDTLDRAQLACEPPPAASPATPPVWCR
ncbi:MAG: hypothetical protein QG612_1156 [Pseudomonadota bacterium]|nr:hypothetical protein [Pseudomonadota bacterium]